MEQWNDGIMGSKSKESIYGDVSLLQFVILG
jgi:hypothetical protein